MSEKLCILISCLIKVIFRKKYGSISDPKKVLIIQRAKLGDMICATPVFRAVKEKYPECKLFVAGNEINRELLKNNSDVDGYICLNKLNFREAVRLIKRENFDYGCTIIPDFLSLAALCLGDVKRVSAPRLAKGVSNSNTLSYRILGKFFRGIPLLPGRYFPRQYLNFLIPIGIKTENTKKHLGFSKEAEFKINEFLDSNNIKPTDLIIGISPSAGNKIKNWPAKNFAQLADRIYKEHGTKVIVIGYGKDSVDVDKMIADLNPDTKVLNTLNLFNIDELKAIVSKMDILISVDTGPIYIAEAFDVATVDIIGPIDEREQPPFGEYHRVVKPVDRGEPQLSVLNARRYNEKEARRQAESISIEMVIKETNYLIAKIH